MAFTEYYEARSVIKEIISKDLLGPVEEEEVISNDRPLDYYILGKLYPADTNAEITLGTSADDCGDLDEENSISLCNGKNPSSFGLSVALKKESRFFRVKGKAARYIKVEFDEVKERLNLQDTDENRKKTYWKREQIPQIKEEVNLSELKTGISKSIDVAEGLRINVLAHRTMKDGARIITVTMTNTFPKCDDHKMESAFAFFQPELVIEEMEEGSIGELAYNVSMSTDEEVLELNMLYHEVKSYASGHGCAVQVEDNNGLKRIVSRFLPDYEVK